MVMILWGMMTWWYTDGWRQCLERATLRLEATLDTFSIGLLLSTLFSPFRQISAGNVRGSFDAQMRAFVDRTISRFIGMMVRLVMIVVGCVVIVCNVVFGLLFVLGWALVPVLPIVGLLLFLIGWVPWSS